MTLTRAPCELDKMSLFQDLKLKRRKVDSRCSSDGESVADTSTSSPDLVCPSSPKISSETVMNPPSPDSTPIQIHPPEPTLEKISGRLEDSGVFDGGGGGGDTTPSTITTTTTAETTTTSTSTAATITISVTTTTTTTTLVATTQTTTTASVIRSLPVVRSQSPPIRPAAVSPSPAQPPRPHSSPGRPANASPVIIHNPNIIVQQSAMSPSKLPTTTTTIVTTCQEPPTSSSPPLPPPPIKQRGVIMSHHHQPSSLTQSQLWLKHSRINGVKPELIGGSFTGAYTPEIKTIIGSTICRSNSNNGGGGGGQPIRQTPTVIMGEAGGVRTMIWSQPTTIQQQQQQLSPTSISNESLPSPQHIPTTSTWPTTNSEESAAQMLLNLGQDRLRTNNRSLLSPQSTTQTTTITTNTPLNMERLWAGDLRQLPNNQQMQALNLSSPTPPSGGLYCTEIKPTIISNETTTTTEIQQQQQHDINDEEEQPMICMICEDKATGLHYGIITCEGCKGFFKRTVQNRRVYTCVADGNCEITKAQRNRCQYCRFKKCIEQGMVLQAVREDRMPGGRNSGAVYNLYKVKYKKHKKPACKQQSKQTTTSTINTQANTTTTTTTTTTTVTTLPTDKCLMSSGQFKIEHHPSLQQQQQQQSQPPPSVPQQQQQHQQQQQPSSIPSNLVNGTILKTALTNPSEVVRLRQRLDSAVSSSRDRNFSIEYSLSMIKTLIDCDEFQDIATLQNLDDLLEPNTDLSEKLCHIGDSIVYKLVQWTKRLPFYLELPVEVHTRLLTHKWHELLVLTTSAYQAIHKYNCNNEQQSTVVIKADFNHEVDTNLCTLQGCLTSMMGREITIDQLRQDVGCMIEKITHVTIMFRQLKLSMEEYVCLKVITMLNQAKPASSTGNSELETIYERYMTCLRVYTQHMYPQQTTRFQELLGRLPEIQSAAALLLESKMFYVPFLLNSAIQR